MLRVKFNSQINALYYNVSFRSMVVLIFFHLNVHAYMLEKRFCSKKNIFLCNISILT
jgi:hypothetical protein